MSKQSEHIQESVSKLPRFGEQILSLLVRSQDRDAILGDFEEQFEMIANQSNCRSAQCWFYVETTKSIPILFVQQAKTYLWRIVTMREDAFYANKNKFATIGLISILPTLLLITAGLLQTLFGLTQFSESLLVIDHPVVIIGGLLLAFTLNILPIVKIKWESEAGSLVGSITVKGRLLNLMMSGLSMFVFSLIFLYLLGSNS